MSDTLDGRPISGANDNGLEFHTFDILSRAPGLAHGAFTRHGGVSGPPFTGLNTAWNIGDEPDAVAENLSRIKAAIGLDRLVATSQVHGDTIHEVDEELLAGAEARPPVLVAPPGDALATRLEGVGLVIKIADCQAVFLVDPVEKAVANVHCGWRGSVAEILPKTVEFMSRRFGSRPDNLLAAVSPSLGPCCAEFRNYRTELPPSFHSFAVKPLYFDFWEISRRQLMEAGLQSGNIEIAGRCTVCESRDFFSYRGEGATGRMAAVIGWRDHSRKSESESDRT